MSKHSKDVSRGWNRRWKSCRTNSGISTRFDILFSSFVIFVLQSWENNLVFYGINIMKDEEHNPDLITGRVTKSHLPMYPIFFNIKQKIE